MEFGKVAEILCGWGWVWYQIYHWLTFYCKSPAKSEKSDTPTKTEISFQGKQLVGNQEKGIVLTQQSLVLQKVERMSSGEYECQAFNSEGYSTSNPVELNIMCKSNRNQASWQKTYNLTFSNQTIMLINTSGLTTYFYILCRIFYDHFVNKFYNLI